MGLEKERHRASTDSSFGFQSREEADALVDDGSAVLKEVYCLNCGWRDDEVPAEKLRTLLDTPCPSCNVVGGLHINLLEKIPAPWTDAQVMALNYFQFGRLEIHPYTCGLDSHHILVATTGGWICSHSDCPYKQDWALDVGGYVMERLL